MIAKDGNIAIAAGRYRTEQFSTGPNDDRFYFAATIDVMVANVFSRFALIFKRDETPVIATGSDLNVTLYAVLN